jgi:inosine-uridine nucleoside N-ribohydrolase
MTKKDDEAAEAQRNRIDKRLHELKAKAALHCASCLRQALGATQPEQAVNTAGIAWDRLAAAAMFAGMVVAFRDCMDVNDGNEPR